MNEKLNEIITEINNHAEWSKNVKIRYAYIELGKIVHKDSMLFYTIQNNLISKEKSDLKYSIDKVREIVEGDYTFDYAVVCRSSAEMLQYILSNCNIDSEVRKTTDTSEYESEGESVTIRHFFLVATGDNNNKYFLTLNPDLPNIQIGRRTSHFATNISYINEEIDPDTGEVSYVQQYEGDEIKNTVMSPEEIEELDRIIGYIDTTVYDNNGETKLTYTDDFFDMLKEAYRTNSEFLYDLSAETPFFYDLSSLINGTKTFEQIFESTTQKKESDLKDLSLNFNIRSKTDDDWYDIKRFIMLNLMFKYYNDYNIKIDHEIMDIYINIIKSKEYEKIINDFGKRLAENNIRDKELKKSGSFNPMLKLRKMIELFKNIDFIIDNKECAAEEMLDFRSKFCDGIKSISEVFIPKKYLPLNKKYLSQPYITKKIELSFKKVFDLGNKTIFNDLQLSEQVTLIKEILDIVLVDVKAAETDIKNRVFSTVIFEKNSQKPYYLICVKNNKNDINKMSSLSPMVFDMQQNVLLKDISLLKVMSDYYVIRDAHLKLMIEEIEKISDDQNTKSI